MPCASPATSEPRALWICQPVLSSGQSLAWFAYGARPDSQPRKRTKYPGHTALASQEGDSTVCLAKNPARGFARHNELDTMPRRKRTRFGSGRELREAAQKDFRRSLSAEEWSLVDPTNSYEFDTEYDLADLDDLLELMRSLPGQPSKSLQRRQRDAAMARNRRLAVEVRDLVCKLRTELFQVPDPPFEHDAAAAARWIESQPGLSDTVDFSLTIATPDEMSLTERLQLLFDWLSGVLSPEGSRELKDQDAAILLRMSNGSSPFRGVSSASPTLAYIDPPADAFAFAVKRVRADDGTKLGALRVAAARLSKDTGWDEAASVHHILTDGLMSVPVTAHVSYGLGGTRVLDPVLRLDVHDPSAVTERVVGSTFLETRRSIAGPFSPGSGRARPSGRLQNLGSLVLETTGMSWAQRWILWNEKHPDDLYSSSGAMARAYSRLSRSSASQDT